MFDEHELFELRGTCIAPDFGTHFGTLRPTEGPTEGPTEVVHAFLVLAFGVFVDVLWIGVRPWDSGKLTEPKLGPSPQMVA